MVCYELYLLNETELKSYNHRKKGYKSYHWRLYLKSAYSTSKVHIETKSVHISTKRGFEAFKGYCPRDSFCICVYNLGLLF